MKTSRESRDEGRGLDGRTLSHLHFFLPLRPQGGAGRGEEANVDEHDPLAPALSPLGRGEGVVSVWCGSQDAPALDGSSRSGLISCARLSTLDPRPTL
jgi:hypothetical protein